MGQGILLIASWTVLVLFTALAVLQLLVAAGLPYGRLVWGGVHERLPASLPAGSAVAAAIFFFAILIVLERAGLLVTFDAPTLVTVALWSLTALFALSTVGNLASRSPIEKRVMTPVAIALTAGCLLLAL